MGRSPVRRSCHAQCGDDMNAWVDGQEACEGEPAKQWVGYAQRGYATNSSFMTSTRTSTRTSTSTSTITSAITSTSTSTSASELGTVIVIHRVPRWCWWHAGACSATVLPSRIMPACCHVGSSLELEPNTFATSPRPPTTCCKPVQRGGPYKLRGNLPATLCQHHVVARPASEVCEMIIVF